MVFLSFCFVHALVASQLDEKLGAHLSVADSDVLSRKLTVPSTANTPGDRGPNGDAILAQLLHRTLSFVL